MNFVPSQMILCASAALVFPVLASPDQAVEEPIEITKSYAQSGDPSAQFNLALHYSAGEERNIQTAINWYKLAAQSGFGPAQYNLGVTYANGKDVPKDQSEALKWLTLAAGQGMLEAQKLLIEMHGIGRGTPKDPATALKWDFIARRTIELRHEQPAGEPPKPPVLRKDGSAELVMRDGTKTILHPDGGEESPGGVSARVIKYKDGRVKVITPDGTWNIRHPSGFIETGYADGRKSIRDPKGTLETTYPDGRKDLEAYTEDNRGRKVLVTENFEANGKRVARAIVRDNVTTRENASGPFAVETVLTDTKGTKVKLTEEILPNGKVGQRKLARLDTGAEPKGTEVWIIRREIEVEGNEVLLVEETYSSLGIGEQTVIERRGVVAYAKSSQIVSKPVESVTMTAPVPSSFARQIEGPSAPVVLKEIVKIEPMLKELEELEVKALHFAGATEADWIKAKAVAASYLIPLPKVPQDLKRAPSWLTHQQLSRSTLPVPSFTVTIDDGSQQFPFGMHGKEVISQYPWKHAKTPHFLVHFIEDSDARLTMQFIEGVYTVIGTVLGLDQERGKQNGHVFLFANDLAWKAYLAKSKNSPQLAGFAYKNELLLPAIVERAGAEESVKTLCHEVTHAIVARFYPGARPPLWLNEGFAEYMAARTIALKRGHTVDKYMSMKFDRPMDLSPVFRRIRYGVQTPVQTVGGGFARIGAADPYPIPAFYANSAWCVRALVEKLPPEGLPKFFNAMSAGNSPDASLRFAYDAKCPDAKAFSALVNASLPAKPPQESR